MSPKLWVSSMLYLGQNLIVAEPGQYFDKAIQKKKLMTLELEFVHITLIETLKAQNINHFINLDNKPLEETMRKLKSI